MMRRIASLATLASLAICACGVVTGIDDYEIVDCPDGGATCNGNGDGSSASPTTDAQTTDAPIRCTADQVLLTIVVVGEDSVSLADPPLTVPGGSTQSVCVTPGALLNATANTDHDVSWSGAQFSSCRRSNTNCDFSISADTTVTVTIRH